MMYQAVLSSPTYITMKPQFSDISLFLFCVPLNRTKSNMCSVIKSYITIKPMCSCTLVVAVHLVYMPFLTNTITPPDGNYYIPQWGDFTNMYLCTQKNNVQVH